MAILYKMDQSAPMGTYGVRDVQLASFKQQAGEECRGG